MLRRAPLGQCGCLLVCGLLPIDAFVVGCRSPKGDYSLTWLRQKLHDIPALRSDAQWLTEALGPCAHDRIISVVVDEEWQSIVVRERTLEGAVVACRELLRRRDSYSAKDLYVVTSEDAAGMFQRLHALVSEGHRYR